MVYIEREEEIAALLRVVQIRVYHFADFLDSVQERILVNVELGSTEEDASFVQEIDKERFIILGVFLHVVAAEHREGGVSEILLFIEQGKARDEIRKAIILAPVHSRLLTGLLHGVNALVIAHGHIGKLLERQREDDLVIQLAVFARNGVCKRFRVLFRDEHKHGKLVACHAVSVPAMEVAIEAGVPMMVGTDASNIIFLPWVKFGKGLHYEMELMNAAGLTPLEIITGATGITADSYALKDTGIIEPGRYADFLLIDGNPAESIGDMAKIKNVTVGGKSVFNA